MAITNGTYKAKAIGQVILGESGVKGTPFIEFFFQITEGENKGGQIKWSGYFTDTKDKKGRSVAERTIEALQICGWTGEDLSEFNDNELHGLGDNEVSIVVELESYEKDGETRQAPKVKWVNRNGGGATINVENAMPKEKAANFSDRMRGLVMRTREKTLGSPNDEFPPKDAPPLKQASGAKKGW